MIRRILVVLMVIVFSSLSCASFSKFVLANEEDPITQREHLFRSVAALSGIPWYYIAAIDKYERNVRNARRDLPDVAYEEPIAIRLPYDLWVGRLNPDTTDTNPDSIHFFNGIGTDGNNDGKADLMQAEDALWSLVRFLQLYGPDERSLRTAIWDLYRHPVTVDVISHMAQVYATFDTIDLEENYFPVSLHHNYTYRSTWGAKRGWGGRRIHEGTDVFANHGTPVYSACYGYVEIKGWNKFGGWRVGVRDLHNNYHYYAHLGSFNKEIERGTVVKPGDLLGYVGNSGYGPPGTAGKFPPHLHYGIYKFNGRTQWSFDPYPYLRKWERKTREKANS